MRTVRARSALIIMSALLLAVAASDSEVDCGAMRTKELRKWLAARGLKCEGCAEKADYVTLCEQNKDAPLLPPEEPLACVARERLLVIDKWPATSAKAASMVLILLYI